jgi:sugar phosphate isomerase/epimerase
MRGIPPIGYCTNVHAGANWQTTRASLEQYAVGVKQIFRPDQPMGIGLWFSNQSSEQLEHEGLGEFAGWLRSQGLVPSTLNGFPFGDFHQAVVKHDVYLPEWSNPSRRQYTERLARLLDQLLPRGAEGSISTLPLAWGAAQSSHSLSACADQLALLANELAKLEKETGRLVYVCIEPEPGCALDTAEDIANFFENHVFKSRGAEEAVLRRHLRICHDICHSVVMFEEQGAAISAYANAGIEIGKVQVSSAVKMQLDGLDLEQRRAALAQLAAFHEPRYLHQTLVRRAGEETPRFYEDLHLALAAESDNALKGGEWRVHFHVPIFVDRFGALSASQSEIKECLDLLADATVKHFEVETYAWGVLPKELQAANLSEGIAKEMAWLAPQLKARNLVEAEFIRG